ncbi:Expansin protein 3 [Phytophthora cinnamomi]|uniref:Expansin protein 3 n=1 Tax=Phytophthora cinnamomi TaxID=4785 RepID=UPI00355999B5|nr:Expansin protein 3 [Phytophthora cinnamomi]
MVGVLQYSALLALGITAASAGQQTYFQGDGTPYNLNGVNMGNCAFMSSWSKAATNYVAVNQAQWDGLKHCGQCIEATCIDSKCKNKNSAVILQVVDRCPECKYGDLDMSPSALTKIVGYNPGRIKIGWKYVDCPNPGTIKVCLKQGSNPWWVAVQPTNARIAVSSVAINGKKATLLDGAYFYYIQSRDEVPFNKLKVTISSVEGDMVSGTYSMSIGQCVDTKQQF